MKKTLKRIISLALSVALLISTMVFANAAQEELKLIVTSDVHYRPPEALVPIEQANYLPGDLLYHHANTKGMLTYEADAIIDEFLAKTEASGTKFLLIPGDLSEEGYWEEHLGIAQKLVDFENRTGVKVFVIPGNHDIRTSNSKGRLDLSDFLNVYAQLGFDLAISRHEGTASYTAELDCGYRLLAIDACVYRTDNSAISDDLFEWINQQIKAADKDGKKLIAMTHFSVLEHFELQSIGADMLCVDQYRTLATTLADAGVKYVFTGHQHANDISYAVTQKGNKIFDIEAGSLITYPNAWREVVFSDKEVKIETKYVEKIDPSLLPSGFNKAQLDLLSTDFQAYSLAYFRAGFKSYSQMILELTNTLASSLNLSEGSAGFKALEAAITALKNSADIPFYDNGTQEIDSVEELAQKAGITLSESDYTNLLDLAGAIYASHYAGNENYSMDSLEITLLGQAINAVLITALTDVSQAAINSLLESIGSPLLLPTLNAFKALGAKTLYYDFAAKAFTKEIVKTLGAGIFTDLAAPDDLNATLEPYGEQWALDGSSVKITDLTYATDIIWRVFKTILNGVISTIF